MATRTPLTLTTAFQRVSFNTWTLLKRGRKIGLGIPEETITTLNLLNLGELNIDGFSVSSFSKRAEADTGADWEWWFGRVNGPWIGFRVQAKVLNLRSDKFEHLHYGPRNGTGTQAEQLVHSAFSSDPPRIPLYCMYAHWMKRQCYDGFQLPLNQPLHGCSLVSPGMVHRLYEERKNHLHSVFPFMWPWHKLISEIPSTTDVAAGVQKSAISILRAHEQARSVLAGGLVPVANEIDLRRRRADRELDLAFAQKLTPTTSPPSYVKAALHGDLSPSDLVQSKADPSLAGVTIFARRDGTAANPPLSP